MFDYLLFFTFCYISLSDAQIANGCDSTGKTCITFSGCGVTTSTSNSDIATITTTGIDTVEFELQYDSASIDWIAIGISTSASMFDSYIFLCHRTSGGGVTVQERKSGNSYTPPSIVTSNLVTVSTTNSGGVLNCKFTSPVTRTPQLNDATGYHVLLARGEYLTDIQKHSSRCVISSKMQIADTTPFETSSVTSSSVESTPSIEYTSSVESTPSIEYTSSVESTPSIEYTSSVESTSSIEYTSSVESTPSIEYTSSVESTSSIEYTSSVESTSSIEYTSSVESTSSIEYTSSVESTPSIIPTSSSTMQSSAIYSLMSTVVTSVPITTTIPMHSCGMAGTTCLKFTDCDSTSNPSDTNIASIHTVGSNTVEFQLQYDDATIGWIAIGISNTPTMLDSYIFLCHRGSGTGVTVEERKSDDTYNRPIIVTSNLNTISTTNSGGDLNCTFSSPVTRSPMLNDPSGYYILLARGSYTADIAYHGGSNRCVASRLRITEALGAVPSNTTASSVAITPTSGSVFTHASTTLILLVVIASLLIVQ